MAAEWGIFFHYLLLILSQYLGCCKSLLKFLCFTAISFDPSVMHTDILGVHVYSSNMKIGRVFDFHIQVHLFQGRMHLEKN